MEAAGARARVRQQRRLRRIRVGSAIALLQGIPQLIQEVIDILQQDVSEVGAEAEQDAEDAEASRIPSSGQVSDDGAKDHEEVEDGKEDDEEDEQVGEVEDEEVEESEVKEEDEEDVDAAPPPTPAVTQGVTLPHPFPPPMPPVTQAVTCTARSRREPCWYCEQENPDHDGRDCPMKPGNPTPPRMHLIGMRLGRSRSPKRHPIEGKGQQG